MKKMLIAACAALLLASCGKYHHASDDALIKNFYTHRQELESLVSMIQSDRRLHRVDDSWTDPTDPTTIGVSTARIHEYRRLCALCGIPRGFYSSDSGSNISFIATAFGMATGGSGKGYAYLMAPPLATYVVSSTDDNRPLRKGPFRIYRHIEGNWYIEYDYDD